MRGAESSRRELFQRGHVELFRTPGNHDVLIVGDGAGSNCAVDLTPDEEMWLARVLLRSFKSHQEAQVAGIRVLPDLIAGPG